LAGGICPFVTLLLAATADKRTTIFIDPIALTMAKPKSERQFSSFFAWEN
jgi:hypothetical protein